MELEDDRAGGGGESNGRSLFITIHFDRQKIMQSADEKA